MLIVLTMRQWLHERTSMLRFMYNACPFYSRCVICSVVFGEGRILTSSEAFRPNFYKTTELNFSCFPNVEVSFFPGHDSTLQRIRKQTVRRKLLLCSSWVNRSELCQDPTYKEENPTQKPNNIKLTSSCLWNSQLKYVKQLYIYLAQVLRTSYALSITRL
jgi:hypothetical protein